MRMSDVIEEFIKDLFDDNNEYIEIQRNELAEKFNCVPSQINYVISTRFRPSQGYYVESKRGGGGHIRIKKINITKSNYLMHIITSMGDTITSNEVDIFISNFLSYNIVNKTEAKLLKVATSDNVLIVDDFLANGKALKGLIDIIAQAGASVAGASCAIEKGFQKGGDELRADGIKVCSLAIIDSMDDCKISFRKQG